MNLYRDFRVAKKKFEITYKRVKKLENYNKLL